MKTRLFNVKYSNISDCLLHNPSHCKNGTIICIADLNAGTLGAGMYDQPSADIHCHMSIITDQVSRLCTAIIHTGTAASLLIGSTGNTVTEVTVYPEGKSGAVCTIGQAGASRHIRVAYVLAGIFCQPLTHIAAGCIFDHRSIIRGRVASGSRCGVASLCLCLQLF